MIHRVAWRRYSRRFRHPLRVSGRVWASREGIILRIEKEDGSVGYGEIAPVPWFPVESLKQAEAYLLSLSGQFDDSTFSTLDGSMPCAAFAIRCGLSRYSETSSTLPCAALLPAGRDALGEARKKVDEGYTTLKWKIGVEKPEEEWAVAEKLLSSLPTEVLLRLDANGGLNPSDVLGWGKVLQGAPVDYLEQPLAVGQEEEAVSLCQQAGLPLAFDESACTLESLGELSRIYPETVYIIKPSQAGDPQRLRSHLHESPHVRRVYSSAFETAIGYAAVCEIAGDDVARHGASGLGTAANFNDDGLGPAPQGILVDGNFSQESMEALWKQL